ncbi:MAG: HD domain-containing protein, partial [Oscillospiraceae bacterium]|nr:HD domain-containing protein [Oscillospiraceae bacterium]
AEIKAERVSGNSQHVVCLLYIRRLDSDPEIAEADNNSTVISKTPDLTMIRADKLLGGENAVFFEYDDADDEMTVHFPRSEKRTDSVIKNYLTGIDSRGGWTIHRDDIDIIRNSLLRALNGEEVAAKIRYRSIAAETVDFRTHRLTCLPVTGASSALYVVGALTDIDSEARIDQENALLNVRMRELPAVIFTDIFEIDTENDTIDRIVRTDTGYAPKKDAKKLSKYVSFIISSGIISPDAEIYYSSLIKEGFLEEKTRNGPFEFESQHRSRGETKYRNMHEVIMRLDRKHRFLLLRHELAALDRSREVKAEADQAEKKNELQKLVGLLQTKNTGSKDHNMHVSHITTILLEDLLTRRPQYGITPESIRAYAEAGFLHDIGKVTIPDDILETRGERSDEDRIKYEKHTINGAVLLDRVDSSKNGERLAACRDAALHHHERYDGAGYPERLRGAEISIGAQAVGLADAYDTILGKKCMKESMPHEKAVRYILDGECGAFNPHLLES